MISLTSQGTQKQLMRAVYLLAFLFFLSALLVSLENATDLFASNKTLWILLALFLLFMVGIVPFLNKLKSNKQFLLLLFLLAFAVRFIWILIIKTPAISDFLVMYESALSAAEGDFSFGHDTPYYQAWVYQLGFTMYQALILKLFWGDMFALKFFNVLFSTGTTIIVYLTASKMFNEASGRIAGMFYALYVPGILMCSVLTNQHLSTFLIFLALYLLVSKGLSVKYVWFFIGLLFSLGNIIRPIGSVVLLAVGVFILLFQFWEGTKTMKMAIAKRFIGMIVVYFMVHQIISYSFISMGVTQYPLSNRDPLWKFVVGFNHETRGEFSPKDYNYLWQFPLGEEREKVELKLIKQRVADKQKLMVLFGKKFAYMWGREDFSVYWSLGKLDRPFLLDQTMKLERLFYIGLMVFGAIASIGFIRERKKGPHLLYLILIAGYVAVHFLIEVQTRYRFDILPALIMIQGYGVFLLSSYLRGKKFHRSG